MNKLEVMINNNYRTIYKQAFKRTLRKLKRRLAELSKLDFFNNLVHTTADDGYYTNELIRTIVFIKTQRARLSALAYVVRVTCGCSQLELITTRLKVIFSGFLNTCDEVVELLEKNLEKK